MKINSIIIKQIILILYFFKIFSISFCISFFLLSVIIYFLSFINFSSSFLKTSLIAFVELLNFVNKVNKIKPTNVDSKITVILFVKVNKKRLFVYLYFLEILSLK